MGYNSKYSSQGRHGSFKGVKVGDKQLEELEEMMNHKKVKTEPCVYGGIKLKDNLKDILSLPPKHTTFPKLDVKEFETELQNVRLSVDGKHKGKKGKTKIRIRK